MRWETSERQNVGTLLAAMAAVVALGVTCEGESRYLVENAIPRAGARMTASARLLPEFFCTARAYGGAGYDDFQRRSMKELGIDYVQGLVDFTWGNIERGDNIWKWVATDEQMDQLARAGLKVVAFLICPKSAGLPWDETINRADPRFAAQYGEFAYQVVNRYHDHSAWSGLQTLIKTVRFFDYDFDARISGEYNEPVPPFVYRFHDRNEPFSLLWVAFSGCGTAKPQAGHSGRHHRHCPGLASHSDRYAGHAKDGPGGPVRQRDGHRHQLAHLPQSGRIGAIVVGRRLIPFDVGRSASYNHVSQCGPGDPCFLSGHSGTRVTRPE